MLDQTLLGDVVTLKRGTTYKGLLLGKPGPVLLGLGSIARNGGFRADNLKQYGGDSDSSIILGAGDLYVSLKDVTHSADLLGAVARIPSHISAGRLTQDTVGIQITDSRISPEYLYWMLRTPQYRSYCRKHATGTTNLGLPRDNFLAFKLPTPNEARRRLVGVLSALDDKIAGNAALVSTFGSLANAVFESLLADASVISLTKAARFVNGRAFTKGAAGSGRVVIRIAELNSGIGQSTVYHNIDVADDHLARPGDLLFAWSGSLTVQRWFRPEAIINQHIFKVIPNHGYPTWLVHQLLRRKLEEFRAIAADKATTMGHIQRRHLEEPVMIPSRDGIERQHALMDGLWHAALSTEQESLKLQELRDTLLPQLISGRLRVKDAEKQVEEVV